ncbi:MAG TPA: hypothetical protein VF720_10740 [Candidatus Eisenbacteria bacterium]
MNNLPKGLPGAIRWVIVITLLVAWAAPTRATGIPSFPQYAGILYVVGTQELDPGFTTHAETVAATGIMIGGATHVFPNQAAFEMTRHRDNGPGSAPDDPLALRRLVAEAAPGCTLGLYINAMQVPLKQPRSGQFVYKPMELALFNWITAHDSWLRRAGNGKIVEGKRGWGVFDVRAPGFAEFFGSLVRRYVAEYGITRVLIDETHSTLDHLPGHADIATMPSGAEQAAGMRAMLKAASGGDTARCIWNGHLTRIMAPESYGGRMIQEAAASPSEVVISSMREAMAVVTASPRLVMLEQRGSTPAQRQYLACLATLNDGQSGCGADDFTTPIQIPYPAGSWGRPLEYVNGTSTTPVVTRFGDVETRELEFATIGVNRATKTAIVVPR